MDKRRDFGRWIQSIREEKGLTKRQIAMTLGYKSTGTIHTVEQGINPLPVEKIHPLAHAYGIDVAEILKHIKECEPELYEKYTTLHNDIGRYIMSKFSPESIEIRAHHAPFPFPLISGPMSYNVRNVNQILYIMSTWISDTGTHPEKPQKTTKTARLLQITPKTTNHRGHPPFAQGAPKDVRYRGNEGLLN